MTEGRTIYGNTSDITLYPGVNHLYGVNSPLYERKSFVVTAYAESVSGKEEGVLFAVGGDENGISLFLKDGKLQLAHKVKGKTNYLIAEEKLPTGAVQFGFEYEFNGGSGKEKLFINGKQVGESSFTRAGARVSGLSGFDGTDVGRDQYYSVSDKYTAPFDFTGKLKKVTIHYTKLYNDGENEWSVLLNN
jgi:arylsulfatase